MAPWSLAKMVRYTEGVIALLHHITWEVENGSKLDGALNLSIG